jgi:hypothetical protein
MNNNTKNNNLDPIDEYASRIAKIHNYMVAIEEKCEESMIVVKKKIKIDNDNIIIPTIKDYEHLIKYNYNLSQLKQIAKNYKLKMSGNKNELIKRIYFFLYLSYFVLKIQKLIRGHIQRKYNKLHGPAFMNREICSNKYDFLSMEDLKDIEKHQFFSYKDDEGFIYGFDLLSLYNLIYKCNGAIKNPFSTKPISAKVIEDFRSLLRLSNILKIKICTEINDVTKEVSDQKSIELRALTLFQNIDSLGNHSNVNWFLQLNRIELIKFLRELVDIWSYRAPINNETRRNICPPLGNPFGRVINYNQLQTTENIDDVRKYILGILEKFVNSGINHDSKCLGAYYVLGALTLVSHEAATSLPWLFQAVSYI